jgi:DNA-binding protein HU-beta
VSTIGVQIRSGSRVTIYGFGSFNPTARKARTGRNPRTGAPIKIASARGIRFSPATALKAELNTRKVAGRKAASAKATKTTATPPARSGARTTAVAAKAPTRQVSPPLKKATAAAPTTKKASSTKVMAKKVGTSTKVTKA